MPAMCVLACAAAGSAASTTASSGWLAWSQRAKRLVFMQTSIDRGYAGIGRRN